MTMHSLLAGAYVSGAAWTPANLFANGEIGIWLDPSDLSTMWQDAAKTTAVTSDGDPVGYIADKSGNGFYFSTAVSTVRPTYKTSGGLHWLDFDGVDDGITGSTSGNVAANWSDIATASTYEAVVGCRYDTFDTQAIGYDNPAWFGDNSGYAGVAMGYNIGGAGAKLVAYNWDGNDDYVEIAASAGTDMVASQRLDGGNLYLSKDGGSYSSVASGNTQDISTRINIPYNFSVLSPDGRLYGMIFRKTLFSADRSSAITWMGNKCGLSI